MAYTDFTFLSLKEKFGIQNRRAALFSNLLPLMPSERLQTAIKEAQGLVIRSEKARSEWLVAPILSELRNRNDQFFMIHSGDNLTADEEMGLKGECDFILAKDTGSFEINVPIIQVVEAKKNDIEIGIPQCAAQMLGAKIYNQKYGTPLPYIYGCVTTGDDWLFLRLNDLLEIDTKKFFINEVQELLGAFQSIIDYYKTILTTNSDRPR